MSKLVQMAKEFAVFTHGEQKRKYSGTPYWEHPEEVVSILVEHNIVDENILAAAWLHDVLEDTAVTEGVLRERFGNVVTDMVLGLTDVSKPSDGNRKVRKEKDRLHTSVQPVEVKNIKVADLISNSRSIFHWAESDPEARSFAKLYRQEKLALLDVLQECNPQLLALAKSYVQ